MRETTLKDIITGYKNLSFSDRIAFYSTVSNDINVCEDNLQDFLTGIRMKDGSSCIYCDGTHVVRNGKRKDGIQRYICRDCRITSDHGKTYGIQRINAYHSRLKEFIRRFHGVSTKHLDHYIIWNDLMANSRRKTEEMLRLLLGQVLNNRMRVFNRAISVRPPLPCT